jgi:hypothetical protein
MQTSGSVLPGGRAVFDFTFKSDVPGCFVQRWVMRVTPAQSGRALAVSLRGCCEVAPPDLKAFKQSIDNSLHESERARCVGEVLAAVLDRVARVCAMRRRPPGERVEADVLVDDRAPAFEAANSRWRLAYSPALYASLLWAANDVWDATGVTGFGRFWDMSVESLTAAAMRLRDGAAKRAALQRINEALSRETTPSAAGSLAFSLAFVHAAALLDGLPDLFLRDAAAIGQRLPIFTVPKPPAPPEVDEALDSTRRRHRRRPQKAAPPPPTRKGRKPKEEEPPKPPPEPKQLSPRLRAAVRARIRAGLREWLITFENLATESRAVGRQLTRVNEVDRLDTNLEPEIEDDL